MAFLRIFCIHIFDPNKRHQGLVSVIKQNGHMLYLLVDVQEIRIQPYFCVKLGDYFFFGTPCIWDVVSYENTSNLTFRLLNESKSRKQASSFLVRHV